MADIINLRLARKARDRADAAARAAHNRAASGRTREEKQAARREADALQRALDGARLSDD